MRMLLCCRPRTLFLILNLLVTTSFVRNATSLQITRYTCHQPSNRHRHRHHAQAATMSRVMMVPSSSSSSSYSLRASSATTEPLSPLLTPLTKILHQDTRASAKKYTFQLYSRRRGYDDDNDDKENKANGKGRNMNKGRDRDTATQIISPIEKTIEILCTPIDFGSSSSSLRVPQVPLFYPLSILFLNVLFDTATTIVFDISIVVFYALIQFIRSEDDEDGEYSDIDGDEGGGRDDVILDAVALFGALVTSVILSDGGMGVMISPILSSFGLLSVVGFIAQSLFGRSEGSGTKDGDVDVDVDVDLDPSTRLMELWDEKLLKEEVDKKDKEGQ